MKGILKCRIAEEELWLLPEKAIFWPAKQALLLADVHLGKSSHFRKAGLAVPNSGKEDLKTLLGLVHTYQAERVIFLGDLFHSELNGEWLMLEDMMMECPDCQFVLIKGNHDILPEAVYQQSRLQIYRHELAIFPFLLTHEPPAKPVKANGLYTLCGHIHPGVQLAGSGGQRQKLACFYFGLHYGLLPAFGKFTGLYNIKPSTADAVFGVLPNKVISLHLPETGRVAITK